MNEKAVNALKQGAQHYMKEGNFDKAAGYYERAGLHKESVDALRQGAQHYMKEGNFDKAADYLEMAGLHKESIDALRKGAQHFIKEKNFDRAADYLIRAKLDNEAKSALEKGGEFYLKEKNFDRAADYFERAGMKGKVDEVKGEQSKKGKDSSLEDKVHILGIVGAAFLGSLIFFTENMTGNVISNSSLRPGNTIGLGLFILGIIAALFYLRKK